MVDTLRRPAPSSAPGLPMTPAAIRALEDEIASIERELASAAPEPADDALGPEAAYLPVARLRRRLDTLRAALEAAVAEERAGVAAVGRRVLVATDDGESATYALVLPGDGEPDRGWVAIDAPLGAALAGRRVGEVAVVAAPAGEWAVTLVAVR